MKEFLIYFETSALNTFAESLDIEDIVQGKKHRPSEVIFTTSQYVLWEILNTSNEEKRELLINRAQNILDDYIIVSPIELVNKFIESGYPREEVKRNIKSNCNFARVWSELSNSLNKTFVIDRDDFKMKIKDMYRRSKLLSKLIRSNFNESICKDDEYYNVFSGLVNFIYGNLIFIKEDTYKELIDESQLIRYKISIFFVLSILVLGNPFEVQQYDDFWSRRNAETIEEKVKYILSCDEALFYRGPFIEMAIMAFKQLANETNRGLYIDCLHAMYLPYVGKYYTSDIHFKEFVNGLGDKFESKIEYIGGPL